MEFFGTLIETRTASMERPAGSETFPLFDCRRMYRSLVRNMCHPRHKLDSFRSIQGLVIKDMSPGLRSQLRRNSGWPNSVERSSYQPQNQGRDDGQNHPELPVPIESLTPTLLYGVGDINV